MSEKSDENSSSSLHSRDRLIGEICELDSVIANLESGAPESKKELAEKYNSRGFMKYLQVNFDEAVEDYTKAIERDPNFDVAYYNRGLIHYRLLRFPEATEDMERTLKLNPSFTSASSCLKSINDTLEKKTSA